MTTKELLQLKVSTIMTKNVFCVEENTLVKEVNDIFESNKIHHVPVVNDKGRLVGIISRQDMQLLKHWGTKLNLEFSKKENSILMGSQLAADIMVRQVVSIGENDTLQDCAEIFLENSFHSLPVVKEHKVVGIITAYDLMRAAYGKMPLFIA